MKLNLATVLFVLTSLILAPAHAQEKVEKIKFTKKIPAVGTVMNRATKSKGTLRFKTKLEEEVVDEQTFPLTEEFLGAFTVKKVNKAGITEAELDIKKWTENLETDPTKVGPTVASGKKYLLKIKDGDLVITSPDGKKISKEEADKLKESFEKSFARGVVIDPCISLDKILLNRELKIGESFKLSKKLAQDVFGTSEEPLESANVTLRETKTVLGVKCAVLDVKFELDKKLMAKAFEISRVDKVEFDITDQFVVGIENCWVYKRTAAGPLKMQGAVESELGSMSVELSATLDQLNMHAFVAPKKK